MSQLLGEIKDYWTNRAEGYSDWNKEELAGMQRQIWRDIVCSHMPDKKKEDIKILDVGTGPGFFPIILAEAGYRVHAVDYTPEMLERAKENAGDLNSSITFARMDAKALDFEDDTFDVVLSRNLTWNLEYPGIAYREWQRVLKKGGSMLNFDANWYRFLYDDTKKKEHDADRMNVKKNDVVDRENAKGVDSDWMESIAMRIPCSSLDRPQWDCEVLRLLGFDEISINYNLSDIVWDESEKVNYSSTPMFMIKACK